eukprot:scaffold11611_cov129-Isochrysis_galbana.AAC.1
MLAILARQASIPHSCEFIQSNPSRQSGMVQQPVVNEMVATVHAAGSSLLGLFTSCPFPRWHQACVDVDVRLRGASYPPAKGGLLTEGNLPSKLPRSSYLPYVRNLPRNLPRSVAV